MQKALNILVLGSGGREHAFAWKIAQSPLLGELFIAPGNAGTSQFGTNVTLDLDQFEEISVFLDQKHIDLIIVGPEVPLVNGLVDHLEESNPRTIVIGPKAEGAQLEGSKAFAKNFMARHHIPTASYREFTQDNYENGIAHIKSLPLPIVLKADGLAAGKGVVICENHDLALVEYKEMLSGKFGSAGNRIVIESFLDGIEFSVFVLTDGQSYQILPIAKDYKRIGEDDTGPNTGGMGSISPVSFVDKHLMSKVVDQIVEPTIKGLRQDNIPYQGFIFIGLIKVGDNPYVIEYNCRMGDPETQSVLPRLKNDFVELCIACAEGNLQDHPIELDSRTVASVVLVSGGYPGSYENGKLIRGLSHHSDGVIFHAGTKRVGSETITNGGRVLTVSSYGDDLEGALNASNRIAAQIEFDGATYRRDIGFDLR